MFAVKSVDREAKKEKKNLSFFLSKKLPRYTEISSMFIL